MKNLANKGVLWGISFYKFLSVSKGGTMLSATDKFISTLNSTGVILRVILGKDELYCLPPGCRGVHVVDGQAWIVIAGQDIILTPGEKTWFDSDKDLPLISALGNTPLILELLGDRATIPASTIPQAMAALVRPYCS